MVLRSVGCEGTASQSYPALLLLRGLVCLATSTLCTWGRGGGGVLPTVLSYSALSTFCLILHS